MEKILIASHPKGYRLALLHGDALSKLAFEATLRPGHARLDDILSGRVLSVRHDFVWFDVGLTQEAVVKTSLFHNTIPTEGSYVWLQVSRMPWPELGNFYHHEKGYRMTTQLTLAGRFWLHNPLAKRESKWIHRSAYQQRPEGDPLVQEEKDTLFREAIRFHVPPTHIGPYYQALTQWQRWIRDSADTNLTIICETARILEDVRHWVGTYCPDKLQNLTVATLIQTPLFEYYGVEDHWAEVLTPTVTIKGGGSLDIRELAAATLIDVNAGTERDDAYHLNIKALKPIAEQIIWRNITGNILVDFIRMPKNLEGKFIEAVAEAFQGTDVHILGFCNLGLLQLQRTRLRPSLEMELLAHCPTCHGDGMVEPTDNMQ